MRDVWDSLREFGRKVVRHGYAFVVGVLGGTLGLVDVLVAAAAKPKTTPFSIPLWVWLPLLAGGFLVAIVRGFHDVRMEREDMRAERDAARADVESRFSAMRYALQRGQLEYRIELCPDGTRSIEVGLRLKNNDSTAYLRYEIEHMAVVLEGRSVENATFHNRGTVIPPQGSDTFRYPFIHGVPGDWRTGSVQYAVRYGHPSAPLRYRKSQTLRLTTSRLVGRLPPHDLHIQADLVSDTEVEDV